MKKLLIFSLLAVFAFACSQSEGEKTASEPTAEVKKVDGEKIYKTYCVTCHGLYGEAGVCFECCSMAGTLPEEERIKVITNGRNAMTPFKDLLTEDKIKAVAEYTMTLKQ